MHRRSFLGFSLALLGARCGGGGSSSGVGGPLSINFLNNTNYWLRTEATDREALILAPFVQKNYTYDYSYEYETVVVSVQVSDPNGYPTGPGEQRAYVLDYRYPITWTIYPEDVDDWYDNRASSEKGKLIVY